MITNLLNDKIYIGCHITDNIDDGYMGSGTYLKRAFKKYGIKNFTKEVLFEMDTPEEMLQKEKDLVDRNFVKRKDTYNMAIGGAYNTSGMVLVTNKQGHSMLMFADDERYTSGEYFGYTKGKVPVQDVDGNTSQVSVNDPRYLTGELVHVCKGKVPLKDSNGNISQFSVNDPRYLNGELVSIFKNTLIVKDRSNNYFRVDMNDPRYLNGELVPVWTGRKHNEESKKLIGAANKIHQRGEGNSMYGQVWVYSVLEKKSKRVHVDDLDEFLEHNLSWKKGRKIKFN